MRQLLQNLGNGQTVVLDVPAPGPQAGSLLIRTTRSLISAGTERMLVDFGKAGWIGKARQQPEKVRAVLSKIRANGLFETVRAVRSKLAQPIALGYCQVGVVLDDGSRLLVDGSRGASLRSRFSVGGSPERFDGQGPGTKNQELIADALRVGDRVISNGPHAEVVSVSQHLCARIPDTVSDNAATFTPLAAIALEGIHLLGAQPRDRIVVTGLGLIGQLAVRILRAKGCEVLGLDPSPERRALAEKSGVTTAAGDPVVAALSWTGGTGVPGVLITASTSSNEVVNQAARSCQQRGRVVLVGVVGLQLNRADFYRREVSFQVSCSYGTRDGLGEHSARRNFEQVLAWMAAGKLPVEDLITHRFNFAEAGSAYGALANKSSLGILLCYDASTDRLLDRTIDVDGAPAPEGPGLAIIGAGNFATRTLLPLLPTLERPPRVVSVISRQGAAAWLGAGQVRASRATTDPAVALGDPAVQAIIITTRHDAHAVQTVAALRSGKHVWVEKPLCLNLDELAEIEAVLGSQLSVAGFGATKNQARPTNNTGPAKPVLMVGFNRRFAPSAVALRQALAKRTGPWRFVMTINAGRLDPDHWTLDSSAGGGRIVGEGCHFVDLMRFFAGASISQVRCMRRDTDGQDGGAFELAFADGSSGLIDYRTDLPAHLPKEIIEVTGAGHAWAQIHNWARLRTKGFDGLKRGGFLGRSPRKGHREALQAFVAGIERGVAPVPLDEILEVSRWSIRMQGMRQGETLKC